MTNVTFSIETGVSIKATQVFMRPKSIKHTYMFIRRNVCRLHQYIITL